MQRFLKEGLDGFESHNVLELLLFFSISRQDTNELAHRLMQSFGNMDAVFDAPYEDLLQVDGVGPNTAVLLKLIPQLCRRYLTERTDGAHITDTRSAGAYFLPRYIGLTEEVVMMVCLDNKNSVIANTVLHRGSLNTVEISVRKIVAEAIKHNASNVILAHNHPGGHAIPSAEDFETTRKLINALNAVDIYLVDHILVAEDDFVSIPASDPQLRFAR